MWSNWKSDLLRQLFLKLEDQIKRPNRRVSLNEKIEKIRKNILAKSKAYYDKQVGQDFENYLSKLLATSIGENDLISNRKFFPKKKNLLILLLKKLKMICSMN